MKKTTLAFVTALALTACNNQGNYTINGHIDGAADGDSVFLQIPNGRQLLKVDGAVVKNGKFTFKGKQDSIVMHYLTCEMESDAVYADFFLENGTINATLSAESPKITGTPSNDMYQVFKDEIVTIQKELNDIYDETHTAGELDEQKQKELALKSEISENKLVETLYNNIKKNLTNAVGIHLFKENYYMLDTQKFIEIADMIPERSVSDPAIQAIKESANKMKLTAEGQQYTDFEMKDPNGNVLKLSDYAGKGKVVLVDFWASWCGPCREEMPNLVKLYDAYKNKGLEIVGVSLDQKEDAWKKGIKDMGMKWPQMSDLKYWDNYAARLYAVSSIPHTLLLDKDGTIIARGLRGNALYEKISQLLD